LPDESFARLVIYSDTHSAEELSDSMSLAPDEAWNKGDPRTGARTYSTTAISWRSQLPDGRAPADHLVDLLDRVESLRETLWKQAESGGEIRLKVAFFPTPTTRR
jgi:hypothetical protein